MPSVAIGAMRSALRSVVRAMMFSSLFKWPNCHRANEDTRRPAVCQQHNACGRNYLRVVPAVPPPCPTPRPCSHSREGRGNSAGLYGATGRGLSGKGRSGKVGKGPPARQRPGNTRRHDYRCSPVSGPNMHKSCPAAHCKARASELGVARIVVGTGNCPRGRGRVRGGPVVRRIFQKFSNFPFSLLLPLHSFRSSDRLPTRHFVPKQPVLFWLFA